MNNQADDELNLRVWFQVVWRGKWVVLLATVAASTLAVAYALLATEIYRSQALVQPREQSGSTGGLATVAAQLGGLADLAGISLGSGGDRVVALATLRSRALIEPFIQEKNLLPKLYKAEWDSTEGDWKHGDPDDIPTVWGAYEVFVQEIMNVSEDTKSGLVTVSIEWENADEACQWVSELIARTNEHLRSEAIRDGERNLAYLTEQSRRIGQIELQQSLYSLVESELKKLMLARGNGEFALKTIDPAVVAKKHERPKRALIVALGFLFGAAAGVLIVLARGWRELQSSAAELG